jgi:hypothetical protein
MTYNAEFGPLVLNTDIDDEVVSMLRTWLPLHLFALVVERSLAAGFLERPKPNSYVAHLDDSEFPDERLPVISVASANTVGTPEKDGAGLYYADWQVDVRIITRAHDAANLRRRLGLYEGAIRRILTQQPLNGEIVVGSTRFQGMEATQVARRSATDWLGALVSHYICSVDAVVHGGVGPHVPNTPYPDPDPVGDPNEPYEGYVQVQDVVVDVSGSSPSIP